MPNTTANFDIPFLDGTELVRDYPQFSEDLADAVDAGLVAAGVIKQVVRATDTTLVSTTSTTFIDAGISVSITPTSATSTIFVVWQFLYRADTVSGRNEAVFQIADSGNVGLSGAESVEFDIRNATRVEQAVTLIGFDAPASTSAQTYKGRFRQGTAGGVILDNASATAQLLAIEVAG